MIDRSAGPPPWMQLRDILRTRITSGELSGRVPSEKTLGQQYEVAVGTVRKALGALRDEGLIRTQHGWGSFTAAPAAGDGGGKTLTRAPPPGEEGALSRPVLSPVGVCRGRSGPRWPHAAGILIRARLSAPGGFHTAVPCRSAACLQW